MQVQSRMEAFEAAVVGAKDAGTTATRTYSSTPPYQHHSTRLVQHTHTQ